MGKGFNNYMTKKFFHPASRDNLKRVWMAEQQAEAYKKKQEELRAQYEKEQNLYENKAMLSSDSKNKLSVNFMYEPPPGMKKEREKEDNEPEYKFEWQRKYNAPRESYCKDDTEIRDQPFGIQVRNVRCIKCHKYGHINTDKECSMFSLSMSEAKKIHSEQEATNLLLKGGGGIDEQLVDEGLALKRGVFSQPSHSKHQLVQEESDEERNPETEFLKSLSKKEKKELLKKLEKIEKKHKKRLGKINDSGCSSEESSDEDRKKKKSKKSRDKERKRGSNSEDDKIKKHKRTRKEEIEKETRSKRDRSRDRHHKSSRDRPRERSRDRSRDRHTRRRSRS